MNALSVVSPWGEKIANGEKTIEIRSWKPDFLPLLNVALVQNDIRLKNKDQTDSNGYIVAIIDILRCNPWTKNNCKEAAICDGDFENGFFAWEIGNVRKLLEPVKATARRKIYQLAESEELLIKCKNNYDYL